MCSCVTLTHSQGGRGTRSCDPRWWQQFMPTSGVQDGSRDTCSHPWTCGSGALPPRAGTWRKKPLWQSHHSPCVAVAVQLLSRVQFFVTPWTAAPQVSLSFTISQSLFELLSIASVMPSNHLILWRPPFLLPSIFPSIRIFSNEKTTFTSGGQSIGASASASVFPMNVQD